MYKVYELTTVMAELEGQKDKKFLKEFNTEAEAMSYVNKCINEKYGEPYYVRCIQRENCVMFDYGSWSHFYAIEYTKEGEENGTD